MGALALLATQTLHAQEKGTIQGTVTNDAGSPLPGATVIPLDQQSSAVVTNNRGEYSIKLRPGPWIVRFGFVGFKSQDAVFNVQAADTLVKNIQLRAGVALSTSEVIADGDRSAPVQRIDPKVASRIPSPRGTIEDLLIQAPVNFNSELSSGYNVRGGSFDENLVYVNDIEVYRPFLVRAGQQEGLSFPILTWSSPSTFQRVDLKRNTAIN